VYPTDLGVGEIFFIGRRAFARGGNNARRDGRAAFRRRAFDNSWKDSREVLLFVSVALRFRRPLHSNCLTFISPNTEDADPRGRNPYRFAE
jgi:hypothetical protein